MYTSALEGWYKKDLDNKELTKKYYKMVKKEIFDYFGILTPEEFDLHMDFALTCIKKSIQN